MKLVHETDPVLVTAMPVYDFSKETLEERQEMVRRMVDLMRISNGIGLAAPQVGLVRNLFVMSTSSGIVSCYNPQIIALSSNLAATMEGCLSFPGLVLNVKRPDSVDVKFQDIHGVWQNASYTGIEAVCFQHELDHLSGVTFVSKVGPITLGFAQKRRLKKKGKHA